MSRLSDVPKKVLYNPNTSLGELEPYVFRRKIKDSCFTEYWHVSEQEIFRLEGGQGVIFGRQEYGPWFLLFVFNWVVYCVKPVEDKKDLKKLEELKELLFE